MAKRRATTIMEAGVQTYVRVANKEPTPDQSALLHAFAAMLAEATKKPTRKKKSDDTTKLVISPKEFFDRIRSDCGTHVACEPIDTRWFGQLGRRLKEIPDLERQDLSRLIGFIRSGGVKTWPTTFTFSALIKWLPQMIAKARKEQSGSETKTRQVRKAFG